MRSLVLRFPATRIYSILHPQPINEGHHAPASRLTAALAPVLHHWAAVRRIILLDPTDNSDWLDSGGDLVRVRT